MRGDIFGEKFSIRAGDYDDVVLAVAADVDQRDAGGTFYGADRIYSDSRLAESVFERGSEGIVSDVA